jgi:hypothetical protein
VSVPPSEMMSVDFKQSILGLGMHTCGHLCLVSTEAMLIPFSGFIHAQGVRTDSGTVQSAVT